MAAAAVSVDAAVLQARQRGTPDGKIFAIWLSMLHGFRPSSTMIVLARTKFGDRKADPFTQYQIAVWMHLKDTLPRHCYFAAAY